MSVSRRRQLGIWDIAEDSQSLVSGRDVYVGWAAAKFAVQGPGDRRLREKAHACSFKRVDELRVKILPQNGVDDSGQLTDIVRIAHQSDLEQSVGHGDALFVTQAEAAD